MTRCVIRDALLRCEAMLDGSKPFDAEIASLRAENLRRVRVALASLGESDPMSINQELYDILSAIVDDDTTPMRDDYARVAMDILAKSREVSDD